MKKNFTVILVLLLSLSLFGFKTESNSPKVLRDEKVEADVEIDETAPEISPKLDELNLLEIEVENEEGDKETEYQIQYPIGSELDILNYVEASDDSGVVNLTSFGKVNLEEVGVYELVVLAVDESLNASSLKLEVNVITKEDYEAKKAELEAIRAERQRKLEAERRAAEQKKRREEMQAMVQNLGLNNATGNNAIANTALSLVGLPYVYGGHGPSGFDCSGFVQYVYAQNGISISRQITAQVNSGASVSPENIAPGDIIAFSGSYTNNITHVGIYVGNDMFVHAANPRQGVIVSSLSGWVNIGAGGIVRITRIA